MRLRTDLEVVPSPDETSACLVHDPIARTWHRLSAKDLQEPNADSADGFHAKAGLLAIHQTNRPASSDRSWWQRSMHGYLFFRVPVGDPTKLLDLCQPALSHVMRAARAWLLVVLILFGLSLLAMRGTELAQSARDVLSLDNALTVAVSFTLAKLVHETAHAFAARHYGANVPVMGVAFMLLYPVLYTDTTDAWRLPRHQRLRIDLAGVVAECLLGAVAAFAWIVLPPGDGRTAAFVLMAVTWVGSIAINLNPLMRFDGYHALSNALGMPNLQSRAFAMARWQLRELLFAFGDPPPETLPQPKRFVVLTYAYATWVYRLLLFIGIALLVYHFAFKALGALLFVVEVSWFIVRPLRREGSEWWQQRRKIAPMRRQLLWVSAGLTLAVLFVPWSGTVRASAVLVQETFVVRAPIDGHLLPAHRLGSVGIGTPLGAVVSLDQSNQARISGAQLAVSSARLARAVYDPHHRPDLDWLSEGQRAANDQHERDIANQLRSTVRSPKAGTFVPHERMWTERSVARGDRLGSILTNRMVIRAFPFGSDLQRIDPDRAAWFIPSALDRPAFELPPKRTVERGRPAIDPELLAVNGGPIKVRASGEGRVPVRGTIVAVRFELRGVPYALYPLRGTVHFPAERRSLAVRFARFLAAAAIRESGL